MQRARRLFAQVHACDFNGKCCLRTHDPHNVIDTLAAACGSHSQALDDAPLVALSRLAGGTLRELDISMCRGVTDAGVGGVADACPRLSKASVRRVCICV